MQSYAPVTEVNLQGDNTARIEALLNALPLRATLNPQVIRETPFVTWRGKPSPVYNGFTSDERLHLWQLLKWLVAQDAMPELKCCDICGSPDRLQRHSENYYNPCQAAVVCGACHRLIHLRFWRCREWKTLCHANDSTGKAWFSLFSFEQLNIAQYLQLKYGSHVTDLLNSPLYKLPEACAQMLKVRVFQNDTRRHFP
jgi:hypothetical protein